jgi:hypothetical protein
LIENKKKAYLWYLTTCSETDKIEYKRSVAIVKRETRKIKRQCWDTSVVRIEHDLHGRQVNAYKIIKNLNRIEKDNLQLFGLLCQVNEFQLIYLQFRKYRQKIL